MIKQRYPNCKQGYFVVYTTVNTFVQAVPFDQTLQSNVEQNLDIFFKGHIVKALLGLTPRVYWTFCEKVILNEKEIGNDMKECSVCCDMCGGWIHFHFAGVSEVDENSEWFCDKCLVTLSS